MNESPDNNRISVLRRIKLAILQGYRDTSEFFATDRGKMVTRIGTYLLQAGIVVFLLYQLTEIGWHKFFSSLPTHPLYYLMFLIIYFALPVAEIFAYGFSWDITFREAFPVFIKKRVYNKNVLGYSGEFRLFTWARNKLHASNKEIFKVVRDNNIVSSISSTIVAFGLLITFLLGDQIKLMDYLKDQNNEITIVAAAIIVIIIGAVLYRYRKFFFSMSRKVALSVFGVHALRLLIINVAQVLQWNVVMPEIHLSVWFTFLSMQLIMSRIPFLPNKDLIFIGASLEVSNLVHVSSAGIAGLLIAQNVLDKLMNASLFIIISMMEKRKERQSAETVSESAGN